MCVTGIRAGLTEDFSNGTLDSASGPGDSITGRMEGQSGYINKCLLKTQCLTCRIPQRTMKTEIIFSWGWEEYSQIIYRKCHVLGFLCKEVLSDHTHLEVDSFPLPLSYLSVHESQKEGNQTERMSNPKTTAQAYGAESWLCVKSRKVPRVKYTVSCHWQEISLDSLLRATMKIIFFCDSDCMGIGSI